MKPPALLRGALRLGGGGLKERWGLFNKQNASSVAKITLVRDTVSVDLGVVQVTVNSI